MQTVRHGNVVVLRKETVMDEIRLKDYRCFRDDQTAHLAPLTLLVGENSTGKTSFLAIIRALWEFANDYRSRTSRKTRMISAVSTKSLTSEAGEVAEPKPSLRDSVRRGRIYRRGQVSFYLRNST